MHEIATRAGVGKATVSLALRDDPRLRPETRRRIQKIATKMGYRVNATVANLMAQLRASRTQKYHATLGLLNASSDFESFSGLSTVREWMNGCHERAAQLGYGLESFWLHEPGVNSAQLAENLDHRGIRGLIVAAPLERSELPGQFELIWQRFACISVGLRPAWPPLNFASNDQFSTTLHTVQRLWRYGYHRIGLVIAPELDANVDRRFSAGFWAGHEGLDGCERIPCFPFHPSYEAPFRAWYAEYQPDVIVSIHPEVKDWLEAMHVAVPDQVGLVHLNRTEELHGWSGMHQNNNLVGAAAIDMLIGQLHRNEVGLPDFPKASFVQSTWIDGPTTVRKNELAETYA